MNIIQIEDNLKSIPDQRLQDEMVTPSGMFPQYLVMSEINRRSKMREDYQGRMAANEKTPPRPSIREEMIMSMQPVSRGGIEDMTPLNSISQESSISPISQQPVRMSEGRTVDPFLLYGFEYREDDPETEENEAGYFREQSDAEKALNEYYKNRLELLPQKLEDQKKLQGGLNLLQAGIAVGTSATPQQIGTNLNKLIDRISATDIQLKKQEDDIAKEQVDNLVQKEKFDSDRRADLIKAQELKISQEKEKATAEYMRSLGDKTSPVGRIADEILSGKFGPPESLDIYTEGKLNPKTRLIEGQKIDPKKLLDLATSYQSSIGAATVRGDISKQEELAASVNEIMASTNIFLEIQELIAKGLSPEVARNQIYNRELEKQQKLLGIDTKQKGGIIANSVKDFNDVIENISG
tara:strand:+ start:694 stop:1920 length:1227 start_codon:yes stop_codon:yes gene_type:complete